MQQLQSAAAGMISTKPLAILLSGAAMNFGLGMHHPCNGHFFMDLFNYFGRP